VHTCGMHSKVRGKDGHSLCIDFHVGRDRLRGFGVDATILVYSAITIILTLDADAPP